MTNEVLFGLILSATLLIWFYAGYLIGKSVGYYQYMTEWHKTLYKEALKEIEELKQKE